MSVETFYKEMQAYGDYETISIDVIDGAMHVKYTDAPDGIRRQFEALGTNKYGLDMDVLEGGDYIVFK
jgi:hypothetical protein